MIDPVVPPNAENTTIKPDIVACFCAGKLLKINELTAGYIGAINKPINGKMNAAKGALPHPVTLVPSTPLANGMATKTNKPAPIKQTVKTRYQSYFLNTIPAKKRPNAVAAGKIVAIWMLNVVGKFKTLLLNVGNHDIMLCSIKT